MTITSGLFEKIFEKENQIKESFKKNFQILLHFLALEFYISCMFVSTIRISKKDLTPQTRGITSLLLSMIDGHLKTPPTRSLLLTLEQAVILIQPLILDLLKMDHIYVSVILHWVTN